MKTLLTRRPTAANPNHRDEDGLRRPAPRGDLARALADRASLPVVAPETPRPVEMLEHVTVHGDDKLTAGDLALHELLVAHAYEQTDRTMAAAEYSIPVAHALNFLGEHARRSGILRSLERLRATSVTYGSKATGRIYERVPLLTPWTEREHDDADGLREELRYEIPRPIRALMASQARYAYLELGPLARMSSRYGIQLYRHLAAAMALKVWDAAGDNLHEIDVPVGTMADWLGYREPGGKPLHVGHMRTRAVDPAVLDLVNVRRFAVVAVNVRRAKAKGAPIEAWTFTLRLNAPTQHHVQKSAVSKWIFPHVGAIDDQRFRINQVFWLRAASFARKNSVAHSPLEIFPAWLIAADEALKGAAVTDGYATRQHRGQRLLDAIDARGPENAAWDWLVEEVTSPDLLSSAFKLSRGHGRIVRQANRARFHRLPDEVKGGARKRRAAKAAAKAASNPSPAVPREEAVAITPAPSADVPAPAPVAEATGPLACVEFLIDEVVPLGDIEAMRDSIFGMTFTGSSDAPVEATIRFHTGLGTDALVLGDLPLSERDVSFIAEWFDTIIENVRRGRKGA